MPHYDDQMHNFSLLEEIAFRKLEFLDGRGLVSSASAWPRLIFFLFCMAKTLAALPRPVGSSLGQNL